MRWWCVAMALLVACTGGKDPATTGTGVPGCPGVGCAEICDNGVDDDLDTFADCNDIDCEDECDADLDDDGHDDVALGGDDCDDSNPAISPSELEVCDGIDNDCDGLVDDDDPDIDPNSQTPWRRDLDGDGWGESGGPVQLACIGPVGAVDNDLDCNDNQALLNQDDVDGDGYTTCDGDCDDNDATRSLQDIDQDGSTTCDDDCDDTNALLNQLDLDFDGQTSCDGDCDDNDPALTTLDSDFDGLSSCAGDCDDTNPGLNLDDADGDGATSCAGDCNDADPALNLVDADGDGVSTCDGDCDDTDPLVGSTPDGDGDGVTICQGDCDDTDPNIHTLDFDGDGFSPCAGDCDDTNPSLSPFDADGDGFSGCDGDCDLTDPATYPGAYENPGDCIDNDCDGTHGDLGCTVDLYTVRTSDDMVRRFDTTALTFVDIGLLGTAFDFGELAWDPTRQVMWMIDGRGVEGLHTVDLQTGAATLVGIHGVTDLFGLTVDPTTGTIYASGESPTGLYTLDPYSGAATFIGDPGRAADGLTWDSTRSQLIGLAAGGGDLHEMDPLTAQSTVLANQGFINNCGLAYDPQDDLYWAIDWSGDLFTYDPNNGYLRTLVLSLNDAHDGLTHVP